LAQSAKRYFQEEHEDEIFDAISDHIQEYPEELEDRFGRLHRRGELTLEEIEVMKVSTDRHSENELDFEIDTRATVECDEGDHHYDDMCEATPWYSVMGTGSLDDWLEDFSITGVVPYEKRSWHPLHALKDTFVPDIRKENLDAVAEQVLERYYPEALREPAAIDTDVLLKRLRLRKVERRISADASVFGRIYFEDVDADFYNEETRKMETVHVKAGTIFVDPMIFFLRTMGSLKNTIIHECVHWIFHRPVFVLEKINDHSLTQLDCAVTGGVRGRTWSVAAQIEWQANALAPRIQMPKRMFQKKADAVLARLMAERQANSVLDVIVEAIGQMAEFFEVSRLAAKIRMVELGYNEARGALIYVDGQYVRPYTCKPGFLKEHQTFSIGFKDVLRLGMASLDLREDPRSCEFVYIDSHFVYNRPRYVEHTPDGLQMTPYALSHMDECCLVFNLAISDGCDGRYHSFCFLNRAEDSPIVFTTEYAKGLDMAGTAVQDKAERDAMNEAYDLLKTLPGDYADALTRLVEDSDMDVEDIAAETGVSPKTIQGMMAGKQGRGSYESLAYVCLSLQLHPAISEYLIDHSPWKFDFRQTKERALREALRHFYGHKMSYIHAKIASLSA